MDSIKDIVYRIVAPAYSYIDTKMAYFMYWKRYRKHAFDNTAFIMQNEKQYEAYVTKLFHSIEKGLSYDNYKAGFGKSTINFLIKLLESYSKSYNTGVHFYRTALDVLNKYVEKNKQFGYTDEILNNKIKSLKGKANDQGGVITVKADELSDISNMNYEALIKSRHSVRTFANEPVSMDLIKEAIVLAQYTPSACNRQGWKTTVIENKDIMRELLQNQNGNAGFGNEIDKLLLVTTDLNYFNKDRELFQAYIDGGMYAENLINCLHFKGIATIPLSASLNRKQERFVRSFLKLNDSEILIIYIGVGKYREKCLTTKSIRKDPTIDVI